MRVEKSWNLDVSVWDLNSSSGEQMETMRNIFILFRKNLGPNTMKKELRNTDEEMYTSSGVKGSIQGLGIGNNLHS